jgi:hypothetical protein
MDTKEDYQEQEVDDPGLLWTVDSWHIHAALQLPNSPVQPGPTPPESCRAFKEFLFQALARRTPLYDEVHGVLLKITSGIREYSLDCVQKMRGNELHKALQVLRELFDQSKRHTILN